MPGLPATCAVETTGIRPEIALTPLTQLRANFKRGRTLKRLHPRHLVFLTRTLRTRRPGVRISQGAPLLLESDSCSENEHLVFVLFRPFRLITRAMIEDIRSCATENLSRSPALSLVSRDQAADEQCQLPLSLLKRSQRKPVLCP